MENDWFDWAKDYPDLQTCLKKFSYDELSNPLRYKYKEIKTILQEGPQCGLVALAMCSPNCGPELVTQIFATAKALKFTNNGEIFSVDHMLQLCFKFLQQKSKIFQGNLQDNKIVEFLFSGGLMLVPYDADKNYTPCCNDGERAHWAVIYGVVQTEQEIHVLASHGTSKRPGIWSLKSLAESNSQLTTFSKERAQSCVQYVLPEGGLDGPNGLCNRCILIYDNDEQIKNC